MADLSYPRKYRARTIDEYVGNERIVSSVRSFLAGGKRPQVVMLEGESGCGKTTMGRLLAKEYHCENWSPETGACCECAYCKEYEEYIASGETGGMRYLTEVDITESSGKDDLSATLEDAQVPSFDGSWKIYLLDEVHRASKALQNRLLKICEEPPEKVLFIFCTTEPDALLGTLLNRVQYRLKVTKPTNAQLVNRLKYVCESEGVQYDSKGLSLVASKSDFVIRQALVHLEQVVVECKNARYESVSRVLEIVEQNLYFEFFNLLLTNRPSKEVDYVLFLSKIKMSIGFQTFIGGLSSFVTRGIYAFHGVPIEGLDKSELKQYKELFSAYGTYDVVRILKAIKSYSSRDLESGLFVLGIVGIGGGTEKGLPDIRVKGDVGMDRAVGVQERVKTLTMTDDSVEEFVENAYEDISTDDILNMF